MKELFRFLPLSLVLIASPEDRDRGDLEMIENVLLALPGLRLRRFGPESRGEAPAARGARRAAAGPEPPGYREPGYSRRNWSITAMR
jgi:hypothetical protein